MPVLPEARQLLEMLQKQVPSGQLFVEEPNLTGNLDITADQISGEFVAFVKDHSIDLIEWKLINDALVDLLLHNHTLSAAAASASRFRLRASWLMPFKYCGGMWMSR